MKDIKKGLLSEEHLRKIKYVTDYKVNESARYRKLVSDGEEFDEVPNTNSYATQSGMPVPASPNFTNEQEDEEPEPGLAPEIPDTEEVGAEDAPDVPDFVEPGEENQEGDNKPEMGMDDNMGGMPEKDPQQEVDDIQNEIIRHNTEAMKSIHLELQNLNNMVNGLNSELNKLNYDVEEVREPTNVEKMINKKDVSYPYYFNLNDMWEDNWFSQQREESQEKGIRELPDGTFVADFDDLPKPSKIDVEDSFNKIV
ncbi:MAG: hypothetical protein ACOCZ5_00410 [bacterium]